MRLWKVFLALAIGVIGCVNEPGPKFPAYVTFAETDQAVTFSPDGTALIVQQIPRVSLYDLENKTVRWVHTTSRKNVSWTFAPSGGYVLLVEGDPDSNGATLAVVRTDSGAPVFTKALPENPIAGNILYHADDI